MSISLLVRTKGSLFKPSFAVIYTTPRRKKQALGTPQPLNLFEGAVLSTQNGMADTAEVNYEVDIGPLSRNIERGGTEVFQDNKLGD